MNFFEFYVYQLKLNHILKSEIDRIWEKGNNVLFDIDVVGGVNIKKQFGDKALSIFVKPPSVKALKERLTGRGTDSDEEIEKRLAKAEEELQFANHFDYVLINNDLKTAQTEAEELLTNFLNS